MPHGAGSEGDEIEISEGYQFLDLKVMQSAACHYIGISFRDIDGADISGTRDSGYLSNEKVAQTS
jgi:hypothetical protein